MGTGIPGTAVLALGLFSGRAVFAAGIQVDLIPDFVGDGVGVTTEWLGSKDYIGAGAPAPRMSYHHGLPGKSPPDRP